MKRVIIILLTMISLNATSQTPQPPVKVNNPQPVKSEDEKDYILVMPLKDFKMLYTVLTDPRNATPNNRDSVIAWIPRKLLSLEKVIEANKPAKKN